MGWTSRSYNNSSLCVYSWSIHIWPKSSWQTTGRTELQLCDLQGALCTFWVWINLLDLFCHSLPCVVKTCNSLLSLARFSPPHTFGFLWIDGNLTTEGRAVQTCVISSYCSSKSFLLLFLDEMLLFSLLISPAQSLHRLLFTEKLFHISEFPPQLYIPVTEQSSLFAKKINSRQSLQKAPKNPEGVWDLFNRCEGRNYSVCCKRLWMLDCITQYSSLACIMRRAEKCLNVH